MQINMIMGCFERKVQNLYLNCVSFLESFQKISYGSVSRRFKAINHLHGVFMSEIQRAAGQKFQNSSRDWFFSLWGRLCEQG